MRDPNRLESREDPDGCIILVGLISLCAGPFFMFGPLFFGDEDLSTILVLFSFSYGLFSAIGGAFMCFSTSGEGVSPRWKDPWGTTALEMAEKQTDESVRRSVEEAAR